MSNEVTQRPERQFVIGEKTLQTILDNLGEQKLKNSLNLYMSIQQGVRPLEEVLADRPGGDAELKSTRPGGDAELKSTGSSSKK